MYLEILFRTSRVFVKFLSFADTPPRPKADSSGKAILMFLVSVVREGTHSGPFTESKWEAFRNFLSASWICLDIGDSSRDLYRCKQLLKQT